MLKPLWIIQTNLGASSDVAAWVSSAGKAGCEVLEVHHIPFSDDVPDVSHDGPVVLYGTVGFITAAHASGRWRPGVFADPSVFTYENWARHYGEMLLNSPDATMLCTISEFVRDGRPSSDDIFVRPQHDTKALVGRVWKAGEFRAWCEEAKAGVFSGVDAQTPIVVGRPFGITSEWRIFVVDGVIAGATRSHHRGRLSKEAGAPAEVIQFAERAISRWNPAPAYVLDVCLSAGNPYIVEAQGFNSAGHYAADLDAVVLAASDAAVRMWVESQSHPATCKGFGCYGLGDTTQEARNSKRSS